MSSGETSFAFIMAARGRGGQPRRRRVGAATYTGGDIFEGAIKVVVRGVETCAILRRKRNDSLRAVIVFALHLSQRHRPAHPAGLDTSHN